MNSFVGQSPFTEKVPARLKDLVERSSLPYLTSAEQIRLAVIIDCMSEVTPMDEVVF
jgi:RAVE protein 1 C terminal